MVGDFRVVLGPLLAIKRGLSLTFENSITQQVEKAARKKGMREVKKDGRREQSK